MFVYNKSNLKLYFAESFHESVIGCKDVYTKDVLFVPREQLAEASVQDLKEEIYCKIKHLNNPEVEMCKAVLKEKAEAANEVYASWAYIPLNKYRIREGKVFGDKKAQYKVLRLLGDRVVYQDTKSSKILEDYIDYLVEDWTKKKYKEITKWEQIVHAIEKLLDPVLGGFLVGLLVVWLKEKLSL